MEQFMNPLTSQSILYFASRSLCTTEAWVTTRWAMKFVYKVGSTIFSKNICWGFAIVSSINKADLPANVTVFHYGIPHPFSCTRVVGIFVPAAPTKRYHPLGSWSSHNSEPWDVTRIIFRLASLRFLWWWQRSATKWDENCKRTEVIKINDTRFFNVLKFWQLANRGWDFHLTRKLIMH